MKTNINPEICEVNLSELQPSAYNPRIITSEALEGLTKSIERFGNVQPIVWNKRSGHIVSGHQRFKVLQKKDVQRTEVIVVDLDENEEKMLNVSQNNPHIQGEFTDDLQELIVDFEELGEFTDLKLDKLIDLPDDKEIEKYGDMEYSEKTDNPNIPDFIYFGIKCKSSDAMKVETLLARNDLKFARTYG